MVSRPGRGVAGHPRAHAAITAAAAAAAAGCAELSLLSPLASLIGAVSSPDADAVLLSYVTTTSREVRPVRAAPLRSAPPPPKPKTVDVLFSFDTTGSMSKYIADVKEVVKDLVTDLLREAPNLRIGVIAHGDYCDREAMYTLRRMYKLSKNADKIRDFMDSCGETGGGDEDECYELVLKTARTFKWGRNSASRALVMIGDANPHAADYEWPQGSGKTIGIDWKQECRELRAMGVKVYGVHCGGEAASAGFYRAIAESTGGSYLSLRDLAGMRATFAAVCLAEADRSGEALRRYRARLEREGLLAASARTVMDTLQAVVIVRTRHTA